ncbi:carbohydrate ABC transporter permease [Desertihabitans brevis]|uniref:Carbohydrate ABC transporter permease n=1 Tax=Desertihabitans brevis TaxID=2268447 RepID=A0A367YQM2_9ACTN|nr:carbohydrate ABC transporter permease [Desertihabitans brevis]RCK68134.1 carbohydrate ABC transporter permease [Desertihabitans brevis]
MSTTDLGTARLGDPTQQRADRAIVRRSRAGRVVIHVCLVLAALVSIFPFYWLVAMATQSTAEIFGYPPKLTFGGQLLANVRDVVTSIDLLDALLNTVFVAGASAVLVMLFDSLAAFAFAKYRFPGRDQLFVVLLVTFLLPGSLSLVPSFILVSRLGWVGGFESLIIPGMANAFGIFLLRQIASSSIDDSLIESARIDGAGFFKTWWFVGVPMMRGGLAFLGIFTFIAQWNDYVWPLIVLVDPERQTLQTALQSLNTIYNTEYGMVMAGALISVVPLIVVFALGARHLIANIGAGALKG